MCLFEQAAKSWLHFIENKYEIIAGSKGKSYIIKLDCEAADFYHLSGMHYANDVDFNLRPSEYYGEKLVFALVDGKLDGTRIEKGRNWPKIKGRLNAIINLQKTLESNFLISRFDPEQVKGTNSQIDADYLIKNLDTDEAYFVFIDEDNNHRQYCKSAFKQEKIDYMNNQQKLTLLKTTKQVNGVEQILYVHPNYRPIGIKELLTV